jgi:hypothetical protein
MRPGSLSVCLRSTLRPGRIDQALLADTNGLADDTDWVALYDDESS